jgi:hypothetical protein
MTALPEFRVSIIIGSRMNVSEIKELYRATPFQPFEFVLPNGSTIEVVHPEFMMFSPDYRTVHVADVRSGATKRIDVKLIVALNELRPPTKRKTRDK